MYMDVPLIFLSIQELSFSYYPQANPPYIYSEVVHHYGQLDSLFPDKEAYG